jgi:hypothetical protein
VWLGRVGPDRRDGWPQAAGGPGAESTHVEAVLGAPGGERVRRSAHVGGLLGGFAFGDAAAGRGRGDIRAASLIVDSETARYQYGGTVR